MRLKYNRYIIFLLIIIFFDLRCFYFASSTSMADNLTLVLEVLFIAYVYFTNREYRAHYKYKWLILSAIVLVITSSLAAYYSYDQPIILGIRAQRHWLVPMFMYFPITKLLQSGKMKLRDLLSALDAIVIVYSVIILAQYFVGESYIFLNILHGIRHMGTIRLFADLSFVRISYFIHLISFFNEKRGRKNLIIDILFIGLELFLEIFVCQSRMAIAAILITSAILFLIQKNTLKKGIVAIVAVITICVFLCTGFGHSFSSSIIDGLKGTGSSVTLRSTARSFYLEELFDDPITAVFGRGYANLKWEQAYTTTRYCDGIYWDDNGILGIMYYYGLLFVVWMVVIHSMLMWDARKTLGSSMFFYLLCGLIGIYTLFPYCYVLNFSFGLVCAIIETNTDLSMITGCINKGDNNEIEESI